MPLEIVIALLTGLFDSVEETKDETFIARVNYERCPKNYPGEGEHEMKDRLYEVIPEANVVNAGNIQDAARTKIYQWWIEFTV